MLLLNNFKYKAISYKNFYSSLLVEYLQKTEHKLIRLITSVMIINVFLSNVHVFVSVFVQNTIQPIINHITENTVIEYVIILYGIFPPSL